MKSLGQVGLLILILGEAGFGQWPMTLGEAATSMEKPPPARVWSRVLPGLAPRRPCSTLQIAYGGRRFSAQTGQGRIKVGYGPDAPILETPCIEILSLNLILHDGTSGQAGAQLLLVGIEGSGLSAVHALPLPEPPGLLSAQWRRLATGGSGETWVAAGWVGEQLYLLDGEGGRLIRFHDSDGDGIPERRDRSFNLSIPEKDRVAVYGFEAGDAEFLLRARTTALGRRRYRDGTTLAVARRHGRWVYGRFPWAQATRQILHVASWIGEGARSLLVAGPAGRRFQVEVASAADETFRPATPPLRRCSRRLRDLVELNEALREGQRLRLRDLDGDALSNVRRVGDRRAIIHRLPAAGVVDAGSRFEVLGEGLSSSCCLFFRELAPAQREWPIAILEASPRRLTLLAPELGGVDGELELRGPSRRHGARWPLRIE